MLKLNLLIALLSSLLLLTSCTTFDKDSPVCVEATPYRGHCVKIFSGERFVVDDTHPYKIEGIDYTWWDMRPLMIQVPPNSWAEIKAGIIKSCKKYPSLCKENISSWERSVGEIDNQIKQKE